MRKRIVIEKLPDGHVIVDKQQLSHRKVSGNSLQRSIARRQMRLGLVQPEWRKTDRKIFRSGAVEAMPEFSSGVTILPFGHPSTKTLAAENEQVAERFVHDAHQHVADLLLRNENFTIKTPRRVVVTITEVA